MACVTCHSDTHESRWGPWCDACHGVSIAPGQLFFRHVATVEGPGGRFPIVFDLSTRDYAYMFKDPVPAPPRERRGVDDMDGFRRPPMRIAHGTLDAMIALSYGDVKGDGDGTNLELSASPASTPEERILIGV